MREFMIIFLFIYFSSLSLQQTYIHPCSDTSNYILTPDPTKRITRINNNANDEGYIIFSSEGNYDWVSGTNPANVLWKVYPRVITDGGLFFGACGLNDSALPTSCQFAADINQKIYFSGVSILYFAPDCYHIEHYINNQYWTTPRHCLSQKDLEALLFNLKIT
jgi:hypothetical protein